MLGGILLCLFSCAKEDEFEMPTLVLSENSIAFDKGVSERNISVTTNQNSWIASSPQEGDWLSLVQDGNVLKVKVTETRLEQSAQAMYSLTPTAHLVRLL